jgi:hypothetical protein
LLLLAHGDRTEARKALSIARELNPGGSSDLSLVQVDVSEGKVEEAHKRLQAVLASDRAT